MYHFSVLSYPVIRRISLIAALLLIIIQPFPVTHAENRDLLPESQKQELSEFYHYLRGRYGQSSSSQPLTEKKLHVEKPDATKIDLKKITVVSDEKQNPQITKTQEAQISKQTTQQSVKTNTIALNLDAAETIDTNKSTQTKREFAKSAPSFYRGLYINNALIRSKHFESFLLKAKKHNINTLVIDIQPHLPSQNVIDLAEENGFYLVARVVVFPTGLKTYPAPKKHLSNVLTRSEEGAKLGFAEIQLDYIRFADELRIKGLTLTKRYQNMSNILAQFESQLRPYQVRISADVFGRIPFNQHDSIGQRMELFDHHLDVIYPMLYPSHFYGDLYRRSKPYNTIFDGTLLAKKRVKNSRIVPYIQAFGMKVSDSGLSVENYIRAQLDATVDSGAAGYIAWNARNDYEIFFKAIRAGRYIKRPKTE